MDKVERIDIGVRRMRELMSKAFLKEVFIKEALALKKNA